MSPLSCGCSPRVGAFIVVSLDIIIGVLTLFPCYVAYAGDPLKVLRENKNTRTEVVWFGLISISTVAVISVLNGNFQLVWLKQRNRNPPRFYAWKSLFYLLSETVGFVVPYLAVPDYADTIDLLVTASPEFLVFALLKVNPVTIGLLGYQLYSFWVLHHYYRKLGACRRDSDALAHSRRGTVIRTGSQSQAPGSMFMPFMLGGEEELREGQGQELSLVPVTSPNVPIYPRLNEFINPAYNPLYSNIDSEQPRKPAKFAQSSSPSKFSMLRVQCLLSKLLYDDPHFPATSASTQIYAEYEVQWKRPHEISKNAKFISDSTRRFDLKKGCLENNWFLAAVSNLSLNEPYFHNVVPGDNSWENGYAGICHFRFYASGSWTEVIVDDRLPTHNGKLLYFRSSDRDEFWGSLLEKAYAKFYGSYAALAGGHLSSALRELTGGSVQTIYLKTSNNDLSELFNLMSSALGAGHLLGCEMDKCGHSRKGFTRGHAYGITHVKKVQLPGLGTVDLLRLRNPWGSEVDWSGNWSDRHPLWNLLEDKIKHELTLIFARDGEFWFPVTEFAKQFDRLEIGYLPALKSLGL